VPAADVALEQADGGVGSAAEHDVGAARRRRIMRRRQQRQALAHMAGCALELQVWLQRHRAERGDLRGWVSVWDGGVHARHARRESITKHSPAK
jgi:hypothetical protein